MLALARSAVEAPRRRWRARSPSPRRTSRPSARAGAPRRLPAAGDASARAPDHAPALALGRADHRVLPRAREWFHGRLVKAHGLPGRHRIDWLYSSRGPRDAGRGHRRRRPLLPLHRSVLATWHNASGGATVPCRRVPGAWTDGSPEPGSARRWKARFAPGRVAAAQLLARRRRRPAADPARQQHLRAARTATPRATAGSSPPTPAARSSARTSTSSAPRRRSLELEPHRDARIYVVPPGLRPAGKPPLLRPAYTRARAGRPAHLAASSRTCRAPTCGSFRLALAAGVALVVVLCLLRLYPLALVAAAVAVPLLFLLYLWDVDVYEDEPLHRARLHRRLGRALRRAASATRRGSCRARSRSCAGSPDTHNLVWLGSSSRAPPRCSSLAGPLLLLPYRKFNDVLDGVTFGACCGGDAARRGGDRQLGRLPAPRLPRRRRPAGSGSRGCSRSASRCRCSRRARAAAACGALLAPLPRARPRPRRPRRCSARRSSRVPPPPRLLVGAAVAELYLKQWVDARCSPPRSRPRGARLAAPADRARPAQEAAERGSGRRSSARAATPTPAHTFCGHCGIALRALPKVARATARRRASALGAASRSPSSALAAARRPAAIAIALRARRSTRRASRAFPCAAAAELAGRRAARRRRRVRSGTPGRAPAASASATASQWNVVKSSSNGLVLQVRGEERTFVVVRVAGRAVEPDARPTRSQTQVSSQPDGFLGVQRDTSAAHVVLSPELGFAHGVAAMYSATVDQPPSPGEKVELAFEAARHGSCDRRRRGDHERDARRARARARPSRPSRLVDDLLDTLQLAVRVRAPRRRRGSRRRRAGRRHERRRRPRPDAARDHDRVRAQPAARPAAPRPRPRRRAPPLAERGGARPALRAAARRRPPRRPGPAGRAASQVTRIYPQRTEIDAPRERADARALLPRRLPRPRRPRRPPLPRRPTRPAIPAGAAPPVRHRRRRAEHAARRAPGRPAARDAPARRRARRLRRRAAPAAGDRRQRRRDRDPLARAVPAERASRRTTT